MPTSSASAQSVARLHPLPPATRTRRRASVAAAAALRDGATAHRTLVHRVHVSGRDTLQLGDHRGLRESPALVGGDVRARRGGERERGQEEQDEAGSRRGRRAVGVRVAIHQSVCSLRGRGHRPVPVMARAEDNFETRTLRVERGGPFRDLLSRLSPTSHHGASRLVPRRSARRHPGRSRAGDLRDRHAEAHRARELPLPP